MPWPLATLVGVGALHGLAAAHDRHAADGTPVPVVHRDVSPQNILLGTGGAVKLSDFGLARARDRTSVLTTPGFIKGKLGYLAPELVGGAAATPQSDLFSMGSVLWESLAGHPLFTGKNDREVMRNIHRGQVPPVSEERPGLPRMLVYAISRALARLPGGRHPTASAMAQDLESALAGALTSTLEIQLRLGRTVADARRQLGRKSKRPESRSTLRLPAHRSRIELTRRSKE
jgi:eukaryotic-like serine/threonine-protein kinase